MRPALSAVLLLSGLLAACVTTPDGRPGADASSSSPGPAAAEGGEAADSRVAALPPLPRLDLADIMTWPRDRLVGNLGTPVFRRKDKGAEILRFRGEGCVLDLYLYPEGPGGAPRIAHVEAREDGGRATDKAACLNRTPRPRGTAS